MKSRNRLQQTLNHIQPDRVTIDFGSSVVTGMHVSVVEKLRKHFGLEMHPLKVIEPYQMLGEVEPDLQEAMGVDVIGIWGRNNMFGIPQENFKPFKTFWGQEILVPGNFNTSYDDKGDLVIYPEGDTSADPSAKMPTAGYFFDAIIRQKPIDDMNLNPENNLEEFTLYNDNDLQHWEQQVSIAAASDKGVFANFGGAGLGDVALVPAMNLKNPKGIRDIAEWYISTLMRQDYIHQVFEKQINIAIKNLSKLYDIAGDMIDVIFICGTDFGTQDSTFCSVETYDELYAPYYKIVNNWIHKNTNWKTFKHCCGAVESFMSHFIDSGFDIINPVQINAAGMIPEHLKKEYGDHLVFWGGGVDTQKMLPFGKPNEIKEQVLKMCDIFSKNGGFVFNTVHNIQANVPIENVVAMLDAVHDFNK